MGTKVSWKSFASVFIHFFGKCKGENGYVVFQVQALFQERVSNHQFDSIFNLRLTLNIISLFID